MLLCSSAEEHQEVEITDRRWRCLQVRAVIINTTGHLTDNFPYINYSKVKISNMERNHLLKTI